jgi:hypothetical protein
MQGEYAATTGYHSANYAVTHNEYQMAEATIGALANIATATAANEVWWQLSHRPILVLSNNWRKTPPS